LQLTCLCLIYAGYDGREDNYKFRITNSDSWGILNYNRRLERIKKIIPDQVQILEDPVGWLKNQGR